MDNAILLTTLGGLFLLGLAADTLGRATRLPRVTVLLVLGLLAGQSGFGLLPGPVYDWFEPVSVVALSMVAFLLGGDLTPGNLARHGRAILSISISVAVITVLVVSAGLVLAGLPVGLALILGAIATATAPAAVTDVIRQSGIRGDFADTLRGIVAIDDVWGLVLFSLALAVVHQSGAAAGVLAGAARDILGALALGAAIGVPAALLTGRLRPGEPLQTEAIGVVLLAAGLSIWLEVSFLITGLTAGAIVANLARHHETAFNEIEHIEWPFMLLFFLLAGASLELGALWSLGWIGAAFIALRVAARLAGGEIGARLAGIGPPARHAYGPALLPQAGVAVGMALVAADSLPAHATTIVTLTIAATVVFEIFGPAATLAALRRVGRTPQVTGPLPGRRSP